MHESAPIKSAARQQACYTPIANHRLLLLIGGLLLLLQGCATTPPPPSLSDEAFAQAKAAYLGNDYHRAFTIAGPRAAAGDPWAQYTLGYLYYYGRGVALDRQLAKEWIQRAAEKGYAPAQEALQHISSAAPKMEQDVGSPAEPALPAAKDNSAPIPPPAEEMKEQPQPSSQAATPPAATPPPAAPSPSPAAADQASEPATPSPAPQTPETAPAAPEPAVAPPAADNSAPPQGGATDQPSQ